MQRPLLWLFVGFLALIVLIQFIPLAGAKTNPPVTAEPTWDSPATRQLAERACFDCHSNETVWPWYSNIAPVSWFVIHHTNEGRSTLNFSEWGQGRQKGAEEAAETVLEGSMPPASYLLMHPEAKLTQSEKQQLADGLRLSLGLGATPAEGEEDN